jgi:myo-inositol-1(or 4)-monophosphatase
MSFSKEQLDDILGEMRGAATDAGKILLDGLGKPTQIEYKGAVDLVSQYDRRAEDLIRKRLGRSFPDIGMLAEESVDLCDYKTETKWIVDPLDGTTNYLHGHPFFAVSIGLEDSGSIVAGVIAVPALNLTMWARSGGGTFCNGLKAKVSSNFVLDKSLVATGFPYDRRLSDDDNTRQFVAFMKRSQGVRRCGAAAVDLAFVSKGVYDGFWEPKLHAWDLAAGVLLVNEAGGRVTDYTGGPIDIYKGYVLASNRHIHEEMIEVLLGTV